MERRDLLKSAAVAAATLPLILSTERASAAEMGPVLALISHPVKDYAVWRPIYDGAEAIRQKAGVTGAEVFRDSKDPNMMVIIHRFPSLEAAQGFLSNPALKDAMMKGGVIAPPTVTLAVAA